ncbi:BTAD domain-containing putative transcriptional regulator [Streptomyces sp. NPDC098781]|uniref:AfsR/SARP family transcriptional regulator n=1 Tax=Streptomyces sp. NPDC098781 TaxID=3366097 RepID=UPI0037F7CE4E
MQFRVLGPPAIYDDVKQRSVQLTGPKQRALFGALVVRLGSPVPTEELIYELWGSSAPDKAGNALQAHVSRLRQQLIELEPSRANTPRLVARASGYVLQARPDALDSVQFRLQVARAKRMVESDPQAAALMLRKALGLWRGRALDGGSRGPLCSAAAARLEEERLVALGYMCEAALRAGQHQQLVHHLEELVAAHPYHPRFKEQLAVALERCGRPGEARVVRESVQRPSAAPAGPTGRPGNVRMLREAGRAWPEAVRAGGAPVTPQVPGPEDFADGVGSQGHEIARLRVRVEELTQVQHALRSEMERLAALVEERSLTRRKDSA